MLGAAVAAAVVVVVPEVPCLPGEDGLAAAPTVGAPGFHFDSDDGADPPVVGVVASPGG